MVAPRPISTDLVSLATRSGRSLRIAMRRALRPARHESAAIPLSWTTLALVCLAVPIATCIIWFDRPAIQWAVIANREGGWFMAAAQWVTHLGLAGWMLAVLLIVGLALSVSFAQIGTRVALVKRIALYADVNFAFFTIGGASLLAWATKNAIGRARPQLLYEYGTVGFEPFSFVSAFASFPSGHSATLGAAAMVLCLLVPRWRSVWIGVALIGGVSRVLTEAHYPSDVIAGLTFGAATVWFAARYLARRNCMFRDDGRLLPYRRRVANPRSRSAIKSAGSSSPT